MMKISARDFAIKAHGNQTYGDDEPYVIHLDEVVAVARKYAPFCSSIDLDTVVTLAYLHDVLEDTMTSIGDVEHFFGYYMLNLVDNLTDGPGINRKERKRNTWYKIRRDQHSVFIKLCDRKANTKRNGKLEMYQKEFPLFEAALYQPGQFEELWTALRDATFPDRNNAVNHKVMRAG